jgi:hypothetical protein
MLSSDLNYIKGGDKRDVTKEIDEIERMLKALIKSLENKLSNP